MAWYDKMAEMDSAAEREAFLRGVFYPGTQQKNPLVVGIVAGWLGGKALAKKRKK